MIIIINTPGRDDEAELRTNAGYLQQGNRSHQIVNLRDIESQLNLTGGGKVDTDNLDTIYIVSHGYPSALAGLSPAELAHKIGLYIDRLFHDHKIMVSTVNLSACNTGKVWQGKRAFVEEFADELSFALTVPTFVTVTAPNGMLVYYPNGESAVIADKDPYVIDAGLDREISAIDTSDVSTAKEEIKPYLEKSPMLTTVAVPMCILANHHHDVAISDADGEDNKSGYFDDSGAGQYTFYTNSLTYNYAVGLFAKKESEPAKEADMDKIGFEIPIAYTSEKSHK